MAFTWYWHCKASIKEAVPIPRVLSQRRKDKARTLAGISDLSLSFFWCFDTAGLVNMKGRLECKNTMHLHPKDPPQNKRGRKLAGN